MPLVSTPLVPSFLVLAAIALTAPSAVADVSIPSTKAPPAPAPRTIRDACQVMRSTAHMKRSTVGWARHLADRRLEQVIRQFYTRHVVARGIDDRSLASHSLFFDPGGTAPGVAAAPCVDSWRSHGGSVPGASYHLVAGHRYAEIDVTVEHGRGCDGSDGGDGRNDYTAFVDVVTLEVVAMFYYNNFQP